MYHWINKIAPCGMIKVFLVFLIELCIYGIDKCTHMDLPLLVSVLVL